MSLTPWRLQVFGKPRLLAPDGRSSRFEQRTLALLCYLAVEGPTSRSRLAGLLWPDTLEAVGRNNLVHLLRRLAKSHHPDLVKTGEQIALGPALHAEISELLGETEPGTPPRVAQGQLLEGVDFDLMPDLAEWLLAWRERLDALRIQHLARLSKQQQSAGDYEAATESVQQQLAIDPLSEEAHRQLMRLLYLHGDRPAALRAYQRCEELLQRQMNVAPMPETQALAELIGRGDLVGPERLAPPQMALTVLRPPELIGRAAPWTRLDAAWQARQLMIVSGEPGMGKSRLAQDFAASRGEVLRIEARPGDAGTPFATAVRLARGLLAAGGSLLPGWIQRELTPLLPELEAGGANSGRTDPLRLHGAFLALLTGAPPAILLLDDLQYADEASFELISYLISELSAQDQAAGPALLVVHRAGELAPARVALLERLVVAGRAVRVAVPPLLDADVERLLVTMNLPYASALAPRMARFTGGNPQFVQETVRHLLETGALRPDTLPPASERLPLPPRVQEVLSQRLARLSPGALGVARAAAVLQNDFTVELVAELLGMPLLDAAAAWEELEAAHLMTADRFGHDLVMEAVNGGLQGGVRRLLHRSAARVLTRFAQAPARIAAHWLAGDDPQQAAPWFIRAAEVAAARFRVREAGAFAVRAAQAASQAGDDATAFDALELQARVSLYLSDRAAIEAVLDDLQAQAQTPQQRARHWLRRGMACVQSHQGERAETAARAGLAELGADAASSADPLTRGTLMATLARALGIQGQAALATSVFQEAVALLESHGHTADLASTLSDLAATLDQQDRHLEAAPFHERACTLLRERRDWPALTVALRAQADNLADLGRVRESLQLIRRALDLEAEADGVPWGTSEANHGLAQAHMDLGEFDLALHHFEAAIQANTDHSAWRAHYHRACLGELLLLLGDSEQAAGLIWAASACADMPGRYRSRTLVALSTLPGPSGEARLEMLTRAEQMLDRDIRPLALMRILLRRAAVDEPGSAHEAARRALELAQAHQLSGFEVAAWTRHAQTAARLGLADQADQSSGQAVNLLATLAPAEITQGEVLWTRAAALGIRAPEQASAYRQKARAWVNTTLALHIPAAYQESFLQTDLIRTIGLEVGPGDTAAALDPAGL